MTTQPRVLSVNVSLARPLDLGKRTVPSGIFKQPVAERVRLTEHGFEGDVQADRAAHGGPDKAVNVYPSEHYPYWSEQLAHEMQAGAFGENLTIGRLLEADAAIGDVLGIGSAVTQITQPRQPCVKLAAKHREPRLVRWVAQSGRTGFYLRVIEPGEVEAGDEIRLLERPQPAITVAEANQILLAKDDRAGAERLLTVPALSAAWREDMLQRIGK